MENGQVAVLGAVPACVNCLIAMLSTRRPDGDLALPIFDVAHAKASFISAPEPAPLTLTKGDLLLQAGLSGTPQPLQLKKNRFKYDNHLS